MEDRGAHNETEEHVMDVALIKGSKEADGAAKGNQLVSFHKIKTKLVSSHKIKTKLFSFKGSQIMTG